MPPAIAARLKSGREARIADRIDMLTVMFADLAGFTEAAQSLLDLPVRIGAPSQTIGMSDQVSGPAYATAVGLLRWGTKLRHHGNGHAPVGAGASAVYSRTVRWIKDFF